MYMYRLFCWVLKNSQNISARENLKDLTKEYDKSENDLKALQSVGQVNILLIIHLHV